jgi:hypothetical protein
MAKIPVMEPKPAPVRSRVEEAGPQDIFVNSNPPRAKAVIDGNLAQACNTPCTLRGLPGRHNIAISQAGYITEYREVNVGAYAMDLPQVVLQKPLGTIFLTTTPRGAAIRVNGELVSQTTPAALKLSPGRYVITVEKNGVSKTETVTVGDGIASRDISLGNQE